MNESAIQWVIKIQTDQVKGPYSTEAVIKMITSGVFSGSEEICKYPAGDWLPLTKQPEFYEALLESLENPVEVDIKKAQKMEAETVIRKSPIKNHNSSEKSDVLKDDIKKLLKTNNSEVENLKKIELNKSSLQVTEVSLEKDNFTADRNQNLTIQLSDIKELKKKEIHKVLPLVLILVIAAVGFYFFLFSNESQKLKGWSLAAPQKNGESINENEAKVIKKKVVKAFQSGQIEQLLVAHRGLANVVEIYPKDLEAAGLLCMAYEQLLPYTKQTSQDLKSITIATQIVRSANPISNYSDSCQVVYLISKGQNKEARSLLEKTLDHPVDERFSLGPFLYLIKGEMLEYEQNFINAAAYYDQAIKLWPQWITARFNLAKMNYKQNNFTEARAQFQSIYDIDKESKAALYGLALVEAKGFKNIEKAFSYFSTGFSIKSALPKDFQIDALFTYAQMLIEKGDKKTALEVAQQGYQLNPSHRGLKEIVLSLGGDDKVENAQAEIMLLGDQFARVGDHLAAQAQYKAAFELDPRNTNAAFKAAKSLWQINQTREAISWLNKAIQSDPKMLQAYVLKSDYESQKYNFVEAAKTLQEASRKMPQNHEVLKGQALLEFRKNNMIGTIQYGERAIKVYDADVELLTLLAQAYIEFYLNAPTLKESDQKKKQEALQSAQRFAGKAVDLEPSWPESQITYSKFLSAKEGPNRGESYLKELIKNYPYTDEYRLALAEFYKSNEKFNDAAEIYLQVVEIDPKNKKANFGLAECYRIINRPDLAQKYYNATSLLDPSDVEPLFSNAKLLLETASGKEAKAKISQAIAKLKVVKEINPNFPKVSYFLAKCFMELGDFQQALDLVVEEKTKNPNLIDPFLLAAEIFYRQEQFKECAAEYSKAIKLRTTGAELYVKASICYRKSDAIDIAEDMLTIAKQKESGFAEIYREQGYIFEKKGFKAQAIESFEKYLELSPNASDRATIEAKVK